MNLKGFFQSHAISRIILMLSGLLVVLLVFQAGIYVGFRKAAFSYDWNMAYFRGTDDPHSILAPFMRDADDLNPHGAVGEIVRVALPTIMVKGDSAAEEIVTISPTTTIRYAHMPATTTDLRSGQNVVVIGVPDENGRIEAVFVRILSPMPSSGSSARSATATVPTSGR